MTLYSIWLKLGQMLRKYINCYLWLSSWSYYERKSQNYKTERGLCCFYCSVAKLCLSLQPHGLKHSRLLCPPLSPEVCSDSCPLSPWCYRTILYCHPLLLLPSVFPSARVFSNELALWIRWPKYWSFSFSLSPSNEYSRLIFFRIYWFDLLHAQRLSRAFSSTTVWKHQYFSVQQYLCSGCHIHTWLLDKP